MTTTAQENHEQIEERMRTAITSAQETALPESRVEEIKDQQDEMTRSFLQGEIQIEGFRERMKELTGQDGIVTCASIEEFRMALQLLGFDKESCQEMVEHERIHYEMARAFAEEGVEATLILHFLIQDDDTLGMYPGTSVDFPEGMADGRAREILWQILEIQPDPSPRDKSQLGERE